MPTLSRLWRTNATLPSPGVPTSSLPPEKSDAARTASLDKSDGKSSLKGEEVTAVQDADLQTSPGELTAEEGTYRVTQRGITAHADRCT